MTTTTKRARMHAIWHLPDRLWNQVKPLLGQAKTPGTRGRPPAPFRRVLDGLLCIPRTGCQWKAAPAALATGSTWPRRFQAWVQAGACQTLWKRLLSAYDARRGIAWRWQGVERASTNAPLGGEATGPNPTDRGQRGTTRHVLSDRRGAPVAAQVTAATTHDMNALFDALDHPVVPRPRPAPARPQPLCLDKGHDSPVIEYGVARRHDALPMPHRGEASCTGVRRHAPKRWVVERTHAWQNRFRRLLIRWEQTVANYEAMIHVACALMVSRLLFLG
jgi:putative transposase